jgi:5-methylcytosine-specific restriction enzyme subunit McrC
VRIDLTENGPATELELDGTTGIGLAGCELVEAHPVPGGSRWLVAPGSKVGVIAIGNVQVRVAPKVPMDRVLFLLQYGIRRIRWNDAPVDVEHAPDLLTAVVEAFERTTRTALLRGLLQGYRVIDESTVVVRGRIRESDQLRRRFALPLPVEVRYDDFTVDTVENRWLRAATRIALRLPGLSEGLRRRLARLDLLLAEVTPLRRRAELDKWHPNRLNARLHDALRLAEVIVDGSSFEPRGGGLAVTGFWIDMAGVFEDFVCAAIGARLREHGGRVATQDPWYLDRAGEVRMKPDLVWYRDNGPAAVIDAKYKAEKPAGFPDADLYQMLAYCTALALPAGHLVYAKGNEAGRVHSVRGSDVTIHAHALDLAAPPTALMAQVVALADLIAKAAIPAALP